jgi:hypothetical protein
MAPRKGQKLQPTFMRALLGSQLHAVYPTEVTAYQQVRTLCGLVAVEGDVVTQRFQADMVSLPSCPTCTNRADELRPKINKEREMAKRRVS